MALFLSQEDIQELTERKRPAAQIRWLRENGYPFDVGAEGNPKVLLSVVESRLGLGKGKGNDFRLVLDNEAA